MAPTGGSSQVHNDREIDKQGVRYTTAARLTSRELGTQRLRD